MEENQKHNIQTIFSVGGEEPIQPLDPTNKHVVGQMGTKREYEKRQLPVATEEIRVGFVYEHGDFITGEREQFKQKCVDAVNEVLRGLEHGTFKIKSVNALIPDR